MYKIVMTDVDGAHWLRAFEDWDNYYYLWTSDEDFAGEYNSRDCKMIIALMQLNPLIISCIKVKV